MILSVGYQLKCVLHLQACRLNLYHSNKTNYNAFCSKMDITFVILQIKIHCTLKLFVHNVVVLVVFVDSIPLNKHNLLLNYDLSQQAQFGDTSFI